MATESLPSERLTDVLGIDAPIVQSGMAGVAGPELVAAVSNAGGLGVMAALGRSPDKVRESIRRVREATDRPVGSGGYRQDGGRGSSDPANLTSSQLDGFSGQSCFG